ncbi:hypothetical protein ABKN59_006206 [Abortiporus biennis]
MNLTIQLSISSAESRFPSTQCGLGTSFAPFISPTDARLEGPCPKVKAAFKRGLCACGIGPGGKRVFLDDGGQRPKFLAPLFKIHEADVTRYRWFWPGLDFEHVGFSKEALRTKRLSAAHRMLK